MNLAEVNLNYTINVILELMTIIDVAIVFKCSVFIDCNNGQKNLQTAADLLAAQPG